jgi:hypothetical protein
VARAEGERIIVSSSLTAARRFGDGLIPAFEPASSGGVAFFP